jgi:hypothetical protein
MNENEHYPLFYHNSEKLEEVEGQDKHLALKRKYRLTLLLYN